jgi:ribosomal protein L16 Arg81 hydroxylase
MPHNSTSVRDLFSPVSFSKFLREHLEKKPLLVRGRTKDRFNGVLSLAGIDEMLTAGYLRYPQVKLVRGGQDIPTESFVMGDDVIDTDALFAEHAKGATIIINALHRHWRPVSYFCRELEQMLSVPVQANVYLTPRFSQGFDVHYDTHDVIVLQIAGEKNWRLYDSPQLLPGPTQRYQAPDRSNLGVPKKCTLTAGDCLYIPRGYLHDATASGEPSLHITVGLLTATWGDALIEAAKMLVREHAPLRQALPIGYAMRPASRAVKRHARRIRKTVATRLAVEEAVEVIAERLISHGPQFLEQHFLDMQRPWLVDARTPLIRRAGVIFRQAREGNKVCLQLYRKKVVMPGFVAPVLKFITTTSASFCADDLPDDLTASSKVVLCRRLLKEGLLKTASGHPAAGDA